MTGVLSALIGLFGLIGFLAGQQQEEDAQALKLRGKELVHAHRTAEAVQVLKRAAPLLPKDAEVRIYLGEALFELQDYDASVAAFKEGFGLEPAFEARSTINFGLACMKAGRTDDAVAHFRILAEQAPRADAKAGGHFGLGLVLTERGDDAGARTEFEEAVKIHPGHAAARYRLGIAKLKAGEPRAAAGDFEFVLGKEPLHPGAAYNLAQALAAAGDEEKAAEARRRFEAVQKLNDTIASSTLQLRADPADRVAMLALARAYGKGGEVQKALLWYDRFLQLGADPNIAAERDRLRATRPAPAPESR